MLKVKKNVPQSAQTKIELSVLKRTELRNFRHGIIFSYKKISSIGLKLLPKKIQIHRYIRKKI
jgi:hypothetical protein